MVGGGDSAAEEAVYLTKYSPEIHLLVRGGAMRASKALQDRVLGNKKITVHFNTQVRALDDDLGVCVCVCVCVSVSGYVRMEYF